MRYFDEIGSSKAFDCRRRVNSMIDVLTVPDGLDRPLQGIALTRSPSFPRSV